MSGRTRTQRSAQFVKAKGSVANRILAESILKSAIFHAHGLYLATAVSVALDRGGGELAELLMKSSNHQ